MVPGWLPASWEVAELKRASPKRGFVVVRVAERGEEGAEKALGKRGAAVVDVGAGARPAK
ncbi:hypothetical protein ADL29_03630 [Streptomyces chattanoogensis]|uniref:Uncharacterized protein n=1 Tax=Streptomyces chattanoogensis TaxID=66876 RepID=A0A0N0H445_9ACTN|nr:hypothetical protein ADL29_03630 [Streptomyces chattanoogensis]